MFTTPAFAAANLSAAGHARASLFSFAGYWWCSAFKELRGSGTSGAAG
ncbi:MAG: hypothetical protein J5855_02610 [Mailhella sp.]|nr:hypothetical protein [Mailhella sp.]